MTPSLGTSLMSLRKASPAGLSQSMLPLPIMIFEVCHSQMALELHRRGLVERYLPLVARDGEMG